MQPRINGLLYAVTLLLWASMPLLCPAHETGSRTERVRTAVSLELLGVSGLYSIHVDRHLYGPRRLRAGYSQLDRGVVFRDGTLRIFPLHVMHAVGNAPCGLEPGACRKPWAW